MQKKGWQNNNKNFVGIFDENSWTTKTLPKAQQAQALSTET